jgi:hypothetical protein
LTVVVAPVVTATGVEYVLKVSATRVAKEVFLVA